MKLHGALTQMVHIEEGGEYILGDNDELPFTLVKNLGQGASANVEMVMDRRSGAVFARKVFRLGGSRIERTRTFKNEVEVIRRLARHHHIIRVFATYISKRETGLVLSPVASQGDLECFLEDFREGECSETGMSMLLSAFGCLASGLAFMHKHQIRHKDIKPRNILIHQNSIIYTDFGYSLDHSADTGSTTTGRPLAFTRKYCAPEISECEPRNAKSDIYSLGCVFYEIFASLGFCDLPDDPEPYHNRIKDMRRLIEGSFGPANEWFHPIGALTCQMIDSVADHRPTARAITRDLWRHYRGHFCPQCKDSLPRDDATDFPQQPLDEYYSTRRINFTTGWITSHEMVSGGTLVDQINEEAYEREGSWTPVQQTPITLQPSFSPPTASPLAKHSHVAQNALPSPSPSPVQDPIANNNARAIVYPATPDFALLKRSSTIFRERQTPPLAFVSSAPVGEKADAPPPQATSSPLVSRAVINQAESSPKTYAMALAGEFTRSIVSQTFPCPYASCREEFTSKSDRMRHVAWHAQLFTCNVIGCYRHEQGFATAEELETHMENVHTTSCVTRMHYQCVVPYCSIKYKIWPKLSQFKRHLRETHGIRESMGELIDRYKNVDKVTASD